MRINNEDSENSEWKREIHEAQILTYMKLAQTPVGLLINFDVQLLKNGIRRLLL